MITSFYLMITSFLSLYAYDIGTSIIKYIKFAGQITCYKRREDFTLKKLQNILKCLLN